MPKMRFDDYWGGGGGSPAPPEGLDERLNRVLASRISQYRYKWRLLALIFGQPDHELIKNQIVVLSKIRSESESGKSPYAAILDGCTSKLRPVCMVVLTTVLGSIPLLMDPFFGAMAVCIICEREAFSRAADTITAHC